MKRVRFSATYPDALVHPLHRRVVTEPSVTRAELLTWSPTGDATTLCWCDGNRETAEAVVDGIDSLVASGFLEDTDGTYAFLRQDDYEFSEALLETVAEARVIFLPPVTFLETGEVRFEAVGETTALGAFFEALSELGTVTIERVRRFERDDGLSCLTDRQRAALEAAVDVGYYEVPRTGTLEEVAAVIDCSKSTAGELVRKAEAAVVRSYTKTE